ncbi:hypothetical protein [Methylobacterium sp. WSM2598]|uniref:hypothetical protein n=1 Tax=Methylobacterium sp. WSM2598 TaxID=398261 RepID=UPI00035C9916|nr:hypothetical protein [Methylobacterium sp. WSM2598]
MTRFLPIATALGEAAALHGRHPTAAQFAEIEAALRARIVIDFETGAAGICYDDGYVIDPAAYVAHQMSYPDIEIRSTPGATPDF